MSPTPPINYLVLIAADQVLPNLYGSVLVPAQVLEELLHEDTPRAVRIWAEKPPAWVQVREGDASRFPDLDRGEAAALALAVETHADALLADDTEARSMARSLGVVAIGTLGILAEAHNASLLDFDTAVQALQATTFHVREAVIEAVRSRLKPAKPDDQGS